MQEPSIAEILAGRFHYESDFQTATPSGNYFWYRKRLQVRDLIQKNLDRLQSERESSEPFRFIDLGCGDGIDLFLIRSLLNTSFPNCEYIGFDGSPLHDYINHLRKDYFKADDVRLEVADLTGGIPFETSAVDFVYCSEVVEHLLEPERLFQEIKRILKPGGFLLLTTPNEPNIFQKAFWLPSARARVEQIVREEVEHPEIVALDGRDVALYGHISCRTNRAWDRTLQEQGLKLVDYRRGAITYGASPFHDSNFILGLKFITEAFLDVFPKPLTRACSDQLIALYQHCD